MEPDGSGCQRPSLGILAAPTRHLRSSCSSVCNMLARPSSPHSYFHQLAKQPHAEEARHVPYPVCAMETAPGRVWEESTLPSPRVEAMLCWPGMSRACVGRCSLPSSHCAGETSHHMRLKYFSSRGSKMKRIFN